MVRTHHEHELITRYRPGFEIVALDCALDETQIRGARLDRLGDSRRISGHDGDRDFPVSPVERDEMARQPIACDRLTRVDCQRASLKRNQAKRGAIRLATEAEG
ncbi:hypothetical protein DSM21852_37170 [Methylocystis bryophila]|nr:hypothetical protein DSM21852_37170 [Methylocystis bryophila]